MNRSYAVSTSILSACVLTTLAFAACSGSTTPGETDSQSTRSVGPEGAVLTTGAFTLTVPAGAVSEPTELRLTVLADTPPTGYHAYSPLLLLEPDGLQLAVPATLSIRLDREAAAPVVFLSSPDGPAYEWLGGVVEGETISAPIRHFSTAFAGRGDSYVDPADRSCTVTRLLEGRTLDPSAVALFVTVDDCHGAPITDLDAGAFALEEDGKALTTESVVTVLPRRGVEVFVTLLLDVSSSVSGHIDELITAAKAFVSQVQATSDVPVRVAISLFSGAEEPRRWLDFWLVPSDVLATLDALRDYTSPDPSSTNLNGALVQVLQQSAAAQAEFRMRNRGGAFTSGYVVVFTDGVDTAAWIDEDAALEALDAYPDTVVGVGLQTADFDRDALGRLTPGGTFTAGDSVGLTTAFGALANRIHGQIAGSYLIGYCSPKKAGTHEVAVRITGSQTTDAASYGFDASGFGPGCSAAVFDSACDQRECGGLGCGACDDRERECYPDGRCLSFCTTRCGDPDTSPNPFGYTQACEAECDEDAIPVPEDTCPFMTSTEQGDYDDDGAGDLCDEDDDDDGVLDIFDECPTGASGWLSDLTNDHDEDGCVDASEDGDDDSDGIDDALDACPVGETGWTSSKALNDDDEDGCRDTTEDADDDDDGVEDTADACPLGSLGWASTGDSDHDGDGCADDDADDDDDDDGVADQVDACPRGEVGWTSGPETDPDGDGCNAAEDDDNDDDGIDDSVDACTTGAAHWQPTAANDYDGDGCRDADEDDDDDGDGVADEDDGCPLGAKGWSSDATSDPDGDGCRDSDEDDDDGDGLVNAVDACPAGLTEGDDHDGDGCMDAEDGDDDGDGVPDAHDACATGLTGWTSGPDNDADHDGCQDAAEDDDDGDGVVNTLDACPDGLSTGPDHDDDGCMDAEDEDDDGDGVLDTDDACPLGPVGWISTPASDSNGDGCALTEDGDGDGLVDIADLCPDGSVDCDCELEQGWCADSVRYLAGPFDSTMPLSPNWNATYSMSATGAVCVLAQLPSRAVHRWGTGGGFVFTQPVEISATQVVALDDGGCLVSSGSALARIDAQGTTWSQVAPSASLAVLALDLQSGRVAWAGRSSVGGARVIVVDSQGQVGFDDQRPGPSWTVAAFHPEGALVLAGDGVVGRFQGDGTGWTRAFVSSCGAPTEVYVDPAGGVRVANRRLRGTVNETGPTALDCGPEPLCALNGYPITTVLDPVCRLIMPIYSGHAFRVCGDDATSEGVPVPISCGLYTAVYRAAAVARPGGFDVLVALDREEQETVLTLLHYGPCKGGCDDGDLCTDDSSGPEGDCIHVPNDAPMCAPP